MNDDSDWEVFREVHRITERRNGATYSTEYLRDDWVPMEAFGDGEDLIYVTHSDPAKWQNPRRRWG